MNFKITFWIKILCLFLYIQTSTYTRNINQPHIHTDKCIYAQTYTYLLIFRWLNKDEFYCCYFANKWMKFRFVKQRKIIYFNIASHFSNQILPAENICVFSLFHLPLLKIISVWLNLRGNIWFCFRFGSNTIGSYFHLRDCSVLEFIAHIKSTGNYLNKDENHGITVMDRCF